MPTARPRRRATCALIVLALALILLPALAAAGDGRCATPFLRSLLDPRPPATSQPGGTPAGPPPNPQVGDQWDWYIWRLNGFPEADLRPCTVRGRGTHCYVVVENQQWNVNIDQADVDRIVERWDLMSIGPHPTQGIYDINVAAFGTPPDRLDMDPRIYLLYYDFDVNADGFFWASDEFPSFTYPPYYFPSNECEVLYLNDSGPDPAGDYMIAVAAHEFEHQIHFEHDEDEVAWVDEGLAELAMYLYGRPDVISSFNTFPDNDLTVWSSQWADYIQTYLWTLYFYERYGGEPAIHDVVHEPGNSILGYDNVLDLHGYTANFEDVFADWTVANYLDNPAVGDGRFGYVGETLPPFSHSASHATYPVGPVNAAVNHWASDYVQFTTAPTGLELGFDGNDFNRFAVWALELDPSQLPRVTRMALSAPQQGTALLPDVGTLYQRAVMVMAGISSVGATTYSYTGRTGVTAIAAGGAPAVGPLTLTLAPNPFGPATAVRYELGAPGRVRLQVFDAAGRLCRTLTDREAAAGAHALGWDGRDAAGRALPAGVYFLRLDAGNSEATARAVLEP